LVPDPHDKDRRRPVKLTIFTSGNNPDHSHTAMLQGTLWTIVKANEITSREKQ
jgi:hypothetical protein